MSALDLPTRRANVATLRAKATTDDERWICDEFVRLFDAIEARDLLLHHAWVFIDDEADQRANAGSAMSDYEREPRELAERIEAMLK